MERQLKMHASIEAWSYEEDWVDVKHYSKQFMLLMLITATFIVLIGIGSYIRSEMPNQQLQNLPAIEINPSQLEGILAAELPHYYANNDNHWFTAGNMALRIFQGLTNVSLSDPTSIVTNEMLFNSIEEQSLLIHGGEHLPNIAPIDEKIIFSDHNDPKFPINGEVIAQDGDTETDNLDPASDEEDVENKQEDNAITDHEEQAPVPSIKNQDKPVAFIYHTHNRESWNSESDKDAQSNERNITLVGERLAQELEALGLGAMVSDTDYPKAVPDYEWEYSYKYSKKTVKEALSSNDQLQYVFDLHRDSQPRKYTTAEINGESYAQVYFIIGQRNPNWEKNKEFAAKLHDKLEEKYPGLSRGIWGKNANSGNAEYNQTLFEQSVLIEVGGVDNSIEECYRTAKALAEVIALIHQE